MIGSSNASCEMAAARIVCRACNADVDALDHVIASISEMLDTTRLWTLEEAARRGSARQVERILCETPINAAAANEIHAETSLKRALGHAASRGHLYVIKVLLKWHPTCNVTAAMEDAAANGQLPVLQWLHNHAATARTHRMTLDAMDSAAVNGHPNVLQWLHANREEGCTTRAMDGAARAGRLDIVQWLHRHRDEGCTTQAMDGAAANGHLEVLAWLHQNRREGCSTLALAMALQKGHVHIIAWLERMHRENEKPLVTWHEKHLTSWPAHCTIHVNATPISI